MRLSSDNTAVVLTSAADLPLASARHPNWDNVPIHVHWEGDDFRDGVDLSAERFYELLQTRREHPRTSQPSPAEFGDAFARLERYERVLVLAPPSQLSGTYDSACLAARDDPRVCVHDTGGLSGAVVLLAEAIERRLARGTEDAGIDAVVARFREAHRYLVALDTLEYLVRGGRAGRAAGLVGQLANVKVVLHTVDGQLVPLRRVRGRARSLDALARELEDGTADSRALRVGISHASAPREAAALEARLRALRPAAAWDFRGVFGPALGTHAGPGAVALFWFLDEDLLA